MGSASRLVKLVLGVVLAVLLMCGAYAAGFGSGYYAHSIAAPNLDCDAVGCPIQPVVACPTCLAPPTAGSTDAGGNPQIGPTTEEEQAFQLFWQVWAVLKENYYGELPNADKMVDGAIRGLLQTLDDRFTSYIAPDLARIINEDASGVFEGIGALVRINDQNQLEIHRPFPGQPADKAGVKTGDIVIAVDGESIAGFGLYEAIGLIRGPAGSKVTLTIERQGKSQSFDITITRAKIDIPIVESKMLPGDIAYVSLYEFSAPASERLETALKELLVQNPKGLVLDLRDNPGGFLQQAVQVSDSFLGPGVVLIERTSDETEEIFRSTAKGIAQDIPLVVLVNAGSASASEIVAGALQDNGRAKLVGEQTFGKGSVQMPHILSNGGELRVTIARWFTPNDRAIHGQGLEPDIKVELTAEDAQAGRDPQLDRAVEFLTTGQ